MSAEKQKSPEGEDQDLPNSDRVKQDPDSSPLSEVPTLAVTPEKVDEPEKDAQNVRRSGRRRRTPVRSAAASDSESEPEFEPEEVKQNFAAKRKLQPVRANWTPDYLLTNPKSKLTTINLPELLSQERAWTELSRSEQRELISLLPGSICPEMPNHEELPNIPRETLKTNSSFMSDVRLFQEDLSAGRYDPVWLRDAQNAMEKRAQGDFDAWKENHREEFWGQKQKMDWNALAGESSQCSLTSLVQAGYVELRDVWLLRAAHTRKNLEDRKELVLVEKEATVTAISELYTLAFSFPPGLHKFSSPANGEDLSASGITNPTSIQEAMIAADGRLEGIRRANAWKDFRCYRRNQDMGSLWDIRELYHHRQTRKRT